MIVASILLLALILVLPTWGTRKRDKIGSKIGK